MAHDWARAHFGSAPVAIGKTIRVYGKPMKIVGVAAPGFRYPAATDIWAPWPPSDDAAARGQHDYHAVAKIKRGVILANARAQLEAIGADLARRYPENRSKTVAITPLQERLVGSAQATLWALMGAVSLVWLIACANTANLLIDRAATRSREIALRAALGAGRGRVALQLFAESCTLAGLAGLAGVLVALLLIEAVVAASPATLPRIQEAALDGAGFLFALALSVASTLILGTVPALQASRLDLAAALKLGGSRGVATSGGPRLRRVLVVAEVSLSVVLLASAGLLTRSLQALQTVELGFSTERVLVAYTEYAVEDDLSHIRARSSFYSRVLDRVQPRSTRPSPCPGFAPSSSDSSPQSQAFSLR